jgi:hypothetical protein
MIAIAAPKQQVDYNELARNGVGNILEHRMTRHQCMVTAVTADARHVTLDGWYTLSLEDAHKQFRRVGRTEVTAVLAVSRHGELLGEGVSEWRAAS